MTAWFVASGNPGISSFLETDLVAVNFYVRVPAGGLSPEAIKSAAAGHDPRWDEAVAATRTRFARQLAAFANDIQVGDQVMTFDAARRGTVLVGRVIGSYQYEAEESVVDHPHVLPVEWVGAIDRATLPQGGSDIPSTPGITVRAVYRDEIVPTGPLEDAPARPTASARRSAPVARSRAKDLFEWEPLDGEHRYVLRQQFDGRREVATPLLVVMLNPAANHLAGFRRSTTCHAVRRWASERGHDGAVYVNLFSRIEPNSARLRDHLGRGLNDAGSDAAIRRIGAEIEGPALAGWGALPPGLPRRLYDERVREVQELLGRELRCLGVTRTGHPRHGRGWRPEDEPQPLPA